MDKETYEEAKVTLLLAIDSGNSVEINNAAQAMKTAIERKDYDYAVILLKKAIKSNSTNGDTTMISLIDTVLELSSYLEADG